MAVALDTEDREEFETWCRLFGPRVGCLKVGLGAFTRWGLAAVEEAARFSPLVFLDLKLHDIPNTVASAVRAVRDAGAKLLTVHAAGGTAMIEAAVRATEDDLEIVAVTLLTHLDDAALRALDFSGDRLARTVAWAELARSAGAGGVVSSPLEVAALRARLPRSFLLVTPGIRFGESHDDQRRVATPSEALAAGADLLVIGRPLTAASDPEAALQGLERRLRGSS